MKRHGALVGLVVIVAVIAAACGSSGRKSSGNPTAPPKKSSSKTVVLMTHDSFAASPQVLAAFTRATGYKVKVLKSGDAGAAIGQAIIVKSDPVADAFFGIDNTFLTRALDNGLFEPFTARGLDDIPAKFQLDPEHRVTPIDSGDVCVNDDLSWFGHDGHPPAPKSLADLAKPEYRKLLVVENPASSSPGLAFVLSTIVAFGDKGWHGYWTDLRKNGVRVVEGWEQAYDSDFTAGGGSGDRPLVVSYASDPAADVVYSAGKKTTPTVGVVPGTCFAQVEFAGVLANAKHPAGARALITFMLTRVFQQDVPLQMYVYPVVTGTPLPKVFRQFAAQPPHPYTLSPETIGSNRKTWTDEWTQIVLQ
jgi:thiamine transport system substrate-binding protein